MKGTLLHIGSVDQKSELVDNKNTLHHQFACYLLVNRISCIFASQCKLTGFLFTGMAPSSSQKMCSKQGKHGANNKKVGLCANWCVDK